MSKQKSDIRKYFNKFYAYWPNTINKPCAQTGLYQTRAYHENNISFLNINFIFLILYSCLENDTVFKDLISVTDTWIVVIMSDVVSIYTNCIPI